MICSIRSIRKQKEEAINRFFFLFKPILPLIGRFLTVDEFFRSNEDLYLQIKKSR